MAIASVGSSVVRTAIDALASAALAQVAELRFRVSRARHGGRRAAAHDRRLPGTRRRLLVVGDSTAVGLGAGSVEESIIGRLAQAFPGVDIESRAACGARAACVVEQLRGSPQGFDAVLIAAGGNDVIRGTPPEELERSLTAAIDLARERADLIVVANSANVGGAPIFAWPLNAVLSRRSIRARRIFSRVCSRRRVTFVNFTFDPERDHFARESERYYSADGLHPTGAAYAWCCEALLSRSALASQLGGAET